MRDKQIMIDGVKYNPCNDCELWDGHHCIGARSYEPNANEHKAICNEHMAKQFYKVYQQLYRKTQECEQKEKELKELKRQYKLSCLDCEYKNTKADVERYRKERDFWKHQAELGSETTDRLAKQLEEKEQECEELLEFNNSLVEEHKTIGNDLYKEIKEYRKKLQSKEQECEELKAQLNDMACMDDDNVLCYPRQELKKECERYKQALDEIAEHYEKVIKNLTTYDEVYDANISIEALHNISDIINKTKDGE